jgi:predicted lipoprotein with Yx(FWY)xxD motif
MKKRLVLTLAGLAISALALAGCTSIGSSGSSGSSSPGSSAASASAPKGAPAATGDTLATATTSLGKIVVNGKGRTVYLYRNDTANSGMSTCYGQCAALWPPVMATATPTVSGVTGTVGTITRTDGTTQVTLNGWPLYTFAADTAAGDVSGQGTQGVWFVVSPSGKEISTKPESSLTPGSTGSSGSSGGTGSGW